MPINPYLSTGNQPDVNWAQVNDALQEVRTQFRYNSFKIVDTASGSISSGTPTISTGWNRDNAIGSLDHNLDFVPSMAGFVDVNGVQAPLPFTQTGVNIAGTDIDFYTWTIDAYADATKIYLRQQITIEASGTTSQSFSGSNIQLYLTREDPT